MWTQKSDFISRPSMIIRVNVVLHRTVVVDSDLSFDLCGSHLQSRQGEVWYWIDMAASLPLINLPLPTIWKVMGIFSLCDPTHHALHFLSLETYYLGRNKMEQQTPIPPKSRMKSRKSQNAPFSHPWFGGEGESRFSIYFVQDCRGR